MYTHRALIQLNRIAKQVQQMNNDKTLVQKITFIKTELAVLYDLKNPKQVAWHNPRYKLICLIIWEQSSPPIRVKIELIESEIASLNNSSDILDSMTIDAINEAQIEIEELKALRSGDFSDVTGGY